MNDKIHPMFKAVKVRLYPTSEQKVSLGFQFGAARWVTNHGLEWRRRSWEDAGERVGLGKTLDNLVPLKQEADTTWLKDADSQVLQQSLMHLDHAFQRFFRKDGRYPRFKNRRVKVIDGRHLRLPKVGDVKAVIHRALIGGIKTVTVSMTATGQYFASILPDDGIACPESPKVLKEDDVLGLDLGLSPLVTDHHGTTTAHPHILSRHRANLRRKQKSVSRQRRGSSNWSKSRKRLAKVHERVANTRRDIHHKRSKQLVDENQAVCVETLKVKNMVRHRRRSQAIQDAAWNRLVSMIEYKSVWYGRHFASMDPWFASTRLCSSCGSKSGPASLGMRGWRCSACGAAHDRDVNAAINIKDEGTKQLKAAGLSVTACGGMRKTGDLPAAA